MNALIVERRQSQLSNLTGALRTPRRFASCLDGGQQERDHRADDGNHHEQFDERETIYSAYA